MTFASAHRLYHPEIENEDVFGKCANLHGHNYTVEVTLKGPIDPKTGYVVDLKILKEIMNRRVKNILDHKNLDTDVDFFKDQVQSAENITVFIWQQLQGEIPGTASLYRVKLHETENNSVEYYG